MIATAWYNYIIYCVPARNATTYALNPEVLKNNTIDIDTHLKPCITFLYL